MPTPEQLSAESAYNPAPAPEAIDAGKVESLKIRFRSFEEAETSQQGIPDAVVENMLTDTLGVGGEYVGVKGYLDKLEQTPEDQAVIGSPERTAGIYLNTLEMIQRNLKLYAKSGTNPDLINEAVAGRRSMFVGLREYAHKGADAIVDRCNGDDNSSQLGYYRMTGLLKVGGKDLLSISANRESEIQSNITVQRQGGGNFVMGYSDKYLQSRVETGESPKADRRIYLNPNLEATPHIFERILQAANDVGLTINLKMAERSYEASARANSHSKGNSSGNEGLRGDGVVIYASEAEANDVLALALAVAQDNPEAFAGRHVSRIVTPIAEGVGVGDQPPNKNDSLTSLRAEVIDYAVRRVRDKLGIAEKQPIPADQKAQAIRGFRSVLRSACKANGINPDNMSFDAPEAIAA